MERFGPRENSLVKVDHLQRWSSLTSLSKPFHFQKFSIHVLLCQKNGQNFGRNVNGLLILFEMSSHFLLIIPLVSNRLFW